MKCLAVLLLLASGFVSAQSAPEVEITAEPHHRLVFSNDQVRVFNVEVAPHAETLMHWHRHDYIYVTFGATEVVNAVKGKDPVTVKLQDGQTGFTPGNFVHVARVSSDQPFHNVTIELLEDDKLRQTKSHWDEDRGLDILQNGTKEVLFVKDGVRVSEVELQAKGVLPSSHAPIMLVALKRLSVIETAPNFPNAPQSLANQVERDAGAAVWLPTLLRPQLTAQIATKFILVEFP
jgi:quercetin dioxygenase-like cupin family protein